MKKNTEIKHEFVDVIPEKLEEGKIYISIKYRTASHKCCCGCGTKIVTPIRPTRWTLGFNGEAVSLAPSIGNWQIPCKSHYWIAENEVCWAEQWSAQEIADSRAEDAEWRRSRLLKKTNTQVNPIETGKGTVSSKKRKKRFIDRIKSWFW